MKKFLVGVDYCANYKPMTIDYHIIEADDLFEALDKASDLYFNYSTNDELNKVYLVEVSEQVRRNSDRYVTRMISRSPYNWRTVMNDRGHKDYMVFHEGDIEPTYID